MNLGGHGSAPPCQLSQGVVSVSPANLKRSQTVGFHFYAILDDKITEMENRRVFARYGGWRVPVGGTRKGRIREMFVVIILYLDYDRCWGFLQTSIHLIFTRTHQERHHYLTLQTKRWNP